MKLWKLPTRYKVFLPTWNCLLNMCWKNVDVIERTFSMGLQMDGRKLLNVEQAYSLEEAMSANIMSLFLYKRMYLKYDWILRSWRDLFRRVWHKLPRDVYDVRRRQTAFLWRRRVSENWFRNACLFSTVCCKIKAVNVSFNDSQDIPQKKFIAYKPPKV